MSPPLCRRRPTRRTRSFSPYAMPVKEASHRDFFDFTRAARCRLQPRPPPALTLPPGGCRRQRDLRRHTIHLMPRRPFHSSFSSAFTPDRHKRRSPRHATPRCRRPVIMFSPWLFFPPLAAAATRCLYAAPHLPGCQSLFFAARSRHSRRPPRRQEPEPPFQRRRATRLTRRHATRRSRYRFATPTFHCFAFSPFTFLSLRRAYFRRLPTMLFSRRRGW